jgi:hypothetical protein
MMTLTTKKLAACVAVCAGGFAADALAAQPGSPLMYNGSYVLSCSKAELVLHLDLGAQIAGAARSFSGNFIAPLDCDGVDQEEIVLFQKSLESKCLQAGLTREICEPLAEDISAAVSEFNNDALGLIPVRVTMSVQSVYNFWNQLFGIYPLLGQHKFADGHVSNLTYTLNNNIGSELGKFGVLGVQLLNTASSGQLGCADIALGAITGRIEPSAKSLSAQFAVDRSLYCAAVDGVNVLAGVIGLSFRGDVTGESSSGL